MKCFNYGKKREENGIRWGVGKIEMDNEVMPGCIAFISRKIKKKKEKGKRKK